ncbi:MAG: hypothetical protein EXR21_03790 [Flavobacteriaceae bacterium]|nr:hypothetical protein [Flavobacteriaceae bacterium]
MVSIRLPENFSPDFVELIPRQRAMVNELVDKGIIASYSLSIDRGRLWVVIQSSSEASVLDILSSFPLIAYMRFEIIPLMFHNFSLEPMHHISWN